MVLQPGELFEALSDAVAFAVVDMDTGKILYTSRPLEQMFGCGMRGQLLDREVEDLIPGHLRERHRQHRLAYAANPVVLSPLARPDLQGLRLDGTVFPVKIGLSACKIRDARCVVVIILDMTQEASPSPPRSGESPVLDSGVYQGKEG